MNMHSNPQDVFFVAVALIRHSEGTARVTDREERRTFLLDSASDDQPLTTAQRGRPLRYRCCGACYCVLRRPMSGGLKWLELLDLTDVWFR